MTDILYVIGDPISHSLSPIIHNYWLKRQGVDAFYDRLHVNDPAMLPDLIDRVRRREVTGFNVTVPHKQAVLAHVDVVTDAAKRIGAVNTVLCEDGRAVGDNTDAYGFYQGLRESVPDFDGTDKTALVIGAGGAARAIMYALADAGFSRIYVHNRTKTHAEALINDFPGVGALYDEHAPAADLVVNTTSLGMKGSAALRLDKNWTHDRTIVYDIVYNPKITPLLADAKEARLRVALGLPMLLHQAAAAFERWYGYTPQIDEKLVGLIENAYAS